MRETPEEITALQALLDASFARSSRHLTSIMSDARRLTAERLSTELPSPAVLNIATVTAKGEPRVSAVDGHFIHGRWYFSTEVNSPKARQLRARPAISAAFTPRDGYGVFCHGRVVELEGDEREMLRDHFMLTYGSDLSEHGEIYYARIDADWLVGFAMLPEEEADMAQAARDREERRRAAAGG